MQQGEVAECATGLEGAVCDRGPDGKGEDIVGRERTGKDDNSEDISLWQKQYELEGISKNTIVACRSRVRSDAPVLIDRRAAMLTTLSYRVPPFTATAFLRPSILPGVDALASKLLAWQSVEGVPDSAWSLAWSPV